MMRATELAQLLLGRTLKAGDWVVDATAGNGHDTAWLAERVGPGGRVFGFDVQAAALAIAAERVKGLEQVVLIHAGHERMSERLQGEAKGRLSAVMFNLGYLPGAGKDIITRTETTLAAVGQAVDWLGLGGIVTVVVYPGHAGGAEEAEAVRAFARGLGAGFAVSQHGRINTRTPAPELIVVERVR
jgi:SAM-dependent methyltransferase